MDSWEGVHIHSGALTHVVFMQLLCMCGLYCENVAT